MSARVILLCGRICAGKTFYASKIAERLNAVVFSNDEIMLQIFGQDAGEMHDAYAKRIENFIYQKSLQIAGAGVDVIIDNGLWKADERMYAKNFFAANGIDCELHYIDTSEEERKKRIEKRNFAVKAGECSAYYVDEGLSRKLDGAFETPLECECDKIIRT